MVEASERLKAEYCFCPSQAKMTMTSGVIGDWAVCVEMADQTDPRLGASAAMRTR